MVDSNERQNIYKTIEKLKEEGMSIIMVTNNIDEILLADRIVVLEDGEIKLSFLKKDILQNIPILKNLNMQIPTIVKLVEILNKNNIKIEMIDWTLEELSEKINLFIKGDVEN